MARSLRSETALLARIVEAKDDQAEVFSVHHGFVPSGSPPRPLMLPLTGTTVGMKDVVRVGARWAEAGCEPGS